MREVITYMIERTADGDEDVALESCEFWAGVFGVLQCNRLPSLCSYQLEPAVSLHLKPHCHTSLATAQDLKLRLMTLSS